jgi:hypothetical protein
MRAPVVGILRVRWVAWVGCVALPGLALSAQGAQGAQGGRTFKARLSPVPIDVTMQSTVAGTGSVTALLVASKLTVNGTFEHLKSPATGAKLHKSPTRGVRGPALFDLAVSHDTSGSITGMFDVTPQQAADLQSGRLYVQLQSEKAPDGNLWGWLLEKR